MDLCHFEGGFEGFSYSLDIISKYTWDLFGWWKRQIAGLQNAGDVEDCGRCLFKKTKNKYCLEKKLWVVI